MKTRHFFSSLILVLALGLVSPVLAAFPNASVYVVHGINGTDLGLGKSLPVDVFVNGAATPLENFTFGSFAGPLDLPSGKYEIEVRLSDPSIVAISTRVDLAVGENASIVAHLTEEGVPKLTKFVNDVRTTETAGNARLVVRHGASAPPVNVFLRDSSGRYSSLVNLVNANQLSTEVEAGSYDAFVVRSFKKLAGPLALSLEASTAYFAYAVGSLRNSTFDVVIQAIPLQ
jgi:Domain of unknown function (DUF4397)